MPKRISRTSPRFQADWSEIQSRRFASLFVYNYCVTSLIIVIKLLHNGNLKSFTPVKICDKAAALL